MYLGLLIPIFSVSEYDYEITGCPIPVLGNYINNMAKYVGCSVKCGTGISKVPDNTSCYNITHRVWENMVHPYRYANCPLGECKNGICEANNKTEDCYKGADYEK
ncbi:hypothetical protein V5799_034243 [Amblyomma americanum]|uniref:Evasin n=1 Tax=Amblyomma americanum TaxID=6943 RepID=A0AAQ4DL07_AMBAM